MSCILTLKAVEKIVYSPQFAVRTTVQFRTWLFWNPFVWTGIKANNASLIASLRHSKINTPFKIWQQAANDRNVCGGNAQFYTRCMSPGIGGWSNEFLNGTLQFRQYDSARTTVPIIEWEFPDPVVVDNVSIHAYSSDVERNKVKLQWRRADGSWSDKMLMDCKPRLYIGELYDCVFGEPQLRYMYQHFITKNAPDCTPARTWCFGVWSATSADTPVHSASAMTFKISARGTPSNWWSTEDRLGLSEKAHSKLIGGVVDRKCSSMADFLIFNMRKFYNTPAYASDIYSIASELEVENFFNRVSQKAGVYDQADDAICGQCANIESLVQIDNFLNVSEKNQWATSALKGGLNYGQYSIRVKAEVQSIESNGIGIAFTHPVYVKALHIVWGARQPPVEPVMRVVWKCNSQIVCDTEKEIVHRRRRILSPSFDVTTF